jgi:hypothetical protein
MLNGYSEITEEEIRAMPHDKLVEAILRLMKVDMVLAQNHRGAALLPDDLADAFRGRVN